MSLQTSFTNEESKVKVVESLNEKRKEHLNEALNNSEFSIFTNQKTD